MAALPITVLILTRNEAEVIGRAIAGVPWADEVLVIDSESTDDTRERAARLGATVHVQPWLGWIGQKRAGVALARNDWIFALDADEIVTEALGDAIRAAFATPPDPRDGFVVERQEEFLGVLMPNARRRSKRATFVRLFNRRHGDWNPDLIVHEEVVVPGRLHRLEGGFLHWRNYRIGAQLDTLNRNADLEARMLEGRSDLALILGMTVKPVLRFGWLYLWCGFWTRGVRGFVAAALHSFAEVLRHAKAWERRRAPPRLHPPPEIWSAPVAPGAAPATERASP